MREILKLYLGTFDVQIIPTKRIKEPIFKMVRNGHSRKENINITQEERGSIKLIY